MTAPPTLVVAFDHIFLGLAPGLRDLDATVGRVLPARPDAVVLQPGALKRMRATLDAAGVIPILRLDGNRSYLAGDWTTSPEWELFTTPEAAARLGARAVIVNLVLGGPAELASVKVVSRVVAESARWELPVLVSALVVRAGREPTVEERVFGARLAEEMGADLVIMYDLGVAAAAALGEASRWCRQPLLAAGPPTEWDAWLSSSLRAGAHGFCLGRSVWGSPDPRAAALAARRALDGPLRRTARGAGE